ncbi:MAG: hypothetical protein K2X87_17165 [Gemmataceae bacterium]|nr:hypothetical protein [Gemmataceae bacterium]
MATPSADAIRARPRRRWHRWAAVGAALLAVAGVTAAVAERLLPSQAPPSAPKAIVRGSLDLGRSEVSTHHDVRFEVANAGGRPLTLRAAATGCACQAVYAETPGGRRTLAEVTVPPGEAVTLGFTLTVSGALHLPQRAGMRLVTNDPDQPELTVPITFTPVARLACVPQTLAFGDVPVGTGATATVEVFADAHEPGADWATVAAEPADRFAVRFTPDPRPAGELGNTLATRVGIIEVTLHAPDAPGPLPVTLVLTAGGKEVYRLGVVGRAVAEVEASPEVVVLPRRSGDGPIYSAQVLLHSPAGRSFAVAAGVPVDRIEVAIDTPGPDVRHVVTVRCTPEAARSRAGQTVTIDLTATVGERTIPVPVRVLFAPEPPAPEPPKE